MTPRRWVATVVLLVVVGVSGCTGSGRPNGRDSSGPLSLGDASTVLCVPAPVGTATMGHRVLRHLGGNEAVLTAVELIDPVDLELVGAFLVPEGDDGLILTGIESTFPPRKPIRGWSERREVVGSRVAAGEEWGTGFGLRRTAPEGRASGVRLRYEVRGRDHVVVYDTDVTLVADRCAGG